MSIYVCGDIHGDIDSIRNIMAKIDNPTKDDFIIVCGDAGFEYEDYIMGHAKKVASQFPGTWIVLRGNHDSRYWDKHTNIENYNQWIDDKFIVQDGWEIVDDDYFFLRQKKYPNIWYVLDAGGIVHLGKYNFLFLPGAYSVDKWYRLRNDYPWNPKEQLTEEERNELYDIVKNWVAYGWSIDFVIGHTFPRKLEPELCYLFMGGIDQSQVDKTTEDWLDTVSEIYEQSPTFKQYFGGHYHDDKQLNDKYTMLYHTVVNLADYEEEN